MSLIQDGVAHLPRTLSQVAPLVLQQAYFYFSLLCCISHKSHIIILLFDLPLQILIFFVQPISWNKSLQIEYPGS